ncbi:unnamed protein product, partial [Owenia fusiformis]
NLYDVIWDIPPYYSEKSKNSQQILINSQYSIYRCFVLMIIRRLMLTSTRMCYLIQLLHYGKPAKQPLQCSKVINSCVSNLCNKIDPSVFDIKTAITIDSQKVNTKDASQNNEQAQSRSKAEDYERSNSKGDATLCDTSVLNTARLTTKDDTQNIVTLSRSQLPETLSTKPDTDPPELQIYIHEGVSKLSTDDVVPGKGPPPLPPEFCCMSGCANCVWIAYADELKDYYKDGGDKAKAEIMKIEDANLRSFLLLELS